MIEYLDLIGRPARDMDCKAVASEVLRRLGLEVPADLWLGDRELWRESRGAVLAGDVILSHPGGRPHVAVVLDPREGLCLTSAEPQGVQVQRMTEALADSTGVYRLRGRVG